MGRAAPQELFFVCGLTEASSGGALPDCLIRMRTPQGTPHVAFVSHELGQRYLDLLDLNERFRIVPGTDVTAQISFDFGSHGVLIFESEEALHEFVLDASEFDYSARVSLQYHAETESDAPW